MEARGLPPCLRVVAAAVFAVQKTADIVMQHPLVVRVQHCVSSMILKTNMQHLSATRILTYELTLLSASNVKVEKCAILNPASLLPIEEEGEPHECMESIHTSITSQEDIKDVPLQNPDKIPYVDESSQ